jgi:hypothetical protein
MSFSDDPNLTPNFNPIRVVDTGSRTVDKPKNRCSAGRFRAPAHRGRGPYCTPGARTIEHGEGPAQC